MLLYNLQKLCLCAVVAGATGLPHSVFAETWKVSPGFHKESGLDISGAICPTAALDTCYAVNDEKKYIQLFSIQQTTIVPGDRLRLIDKVMNGVKMDELDAEAIAYSDGFVYVIGSHGLTRNSSEIQKSRFFVTRFPVDPQSGKPTFAISDDNTAPEIERSAVLTGVLRDHGILGAFFERPLNENGINIEGLAISDGKAYIGLRQPTIGDGVLVLVVRLDCLFNGAACRPVLLHLPVGNTNLGIRDIVVSGDRFLLLTGTSYGDEDDTGEVWGWGGGVDTPELLVEVKLPKDGNPETLLPLPSISTGDTLRALVLFDGLDNGAPIEIAIPSP